jgi:di/tricarboxylate transporter
MMVSVAVLSALISVNGAVAALLPVIVVIAVRLGRPPSQMLMPMVFGAHAGSMLALTGSPVNVLVLEASLDAGAGGFGYVEFALAGIPLVIGCIAIALLLGPRLLPVRTSAHLPSDLSRHARTLFEQFRLTRDVHQLHVGAQSGLVGASRRQLQLAGHDGVALVTVNRAGGGARPLDTVAEGDIVVVRGSPDAVASFANDHALVPRYEEDAALEALVFNRESGLAEVVVPPRSPLVGQRFFPGMVTESGDLVVLAIQRQERDLAAGEALAVGDTMLLQGTWRALPFLQFVSPGR